MKRMYVQPINELIWDKVTSQIRKNGHVVQKAKEMASDLKVNGQKAPTSTVTDPQGGKVPTEGATRVLGAMENGDKEILANDWLDSQGWNDQQFMTGSAFKTSMTPKQATPAMILRVKCSTGMTKAGSMPK